jgi:hypothetical protein
VFYEGTGTKEQSMKSKDINCQHKFLAVTTNMDHRRTSGRQKRQKPADPDFTYNTPIASKGAKRKFKKLKQREMKSNPETLYADYGEMYGPIKENVYRRSLPRLIEKLLSNTPCRSLFIAHDSLVACLFTIRSCLGEALTFDNLGLFRRSALSSLNGRFDTLVAGYMPR